MPKKNKLIAIIFSLLILLGFQPLETYIKADTYYHTTKINATLEDGDSLLLGFDETSNKITWESSDKTIVNVSNKGLITAKSKGKASITATVGKEVYEFKVIVIDTAGIDAFPTTKPTPTITPTPSPTASGKQDDVEITVYVTKTGTKYHTSGCRYLSRSKIPMSLYDARKLYTPCSVCNPPQ